MRAGLALICIPLVFASPAQACHRFAVWKYPYPQRCEVTKPQVDRSWYVEIAAPPLDDDEARADGIEALKKELAR